MKKGMKKGTEYHGNPTVEPTIEPTNTSATSVSPEQAWRVNEYLMARQFEPMLSEISFLLPGEQSPVTRANVLSGIRQFLQWTLDEDKDLLTDPTVTEWADTFAKPATAKNRLSQVRRLYEALQALGLTDRNPFAHVMGPLNRPQDHREWYTHIEIRQLLAQANEKERTLILLGAAAGLRGIEVCELTFEQIDLKARELKIGRVVPMSDELYVALSDWCYRCGHTDLFSRGSDFVLELEHLHELRQILFFLCQRAGVTYKAWHPLRNHAGIEFLRQYGLKTTEHLLGVKGHEAVRPYLHLMEDFEKESQRIAKLSEKRASTKTRT